MACPPAASRSPPTPARRPCPMRKKNAISCPATVQNSLRQVQRQCSSVPCLPQATLDPTELVAKGEFGGPHVVGAAPVGPHALLERAEEELGFRSAGVRFSGHRERCEKLGKQKPRGRAPGKRLLTGFPRSAQRVEVDLPPASSSFFSPCSFFFLLLPFRG